jgi:hypothetical protein
MRRARQRNAVRRRLTDALHQCETRAELREVIVNVLCDWSDVDLLDPVDSEAATERGTHDTEPPSTEAESAPSVEVHSEMGKDYGL